MVRPDQGGLSPDRDRRRQLAQTHLCRGRRAAKLRPRPERQSGRLDPKAFVKAIRAGRVVVSSGPFVRLFANDKQVGDEVPEGELEVEVKVDAAPWVDVDRVELWVNGRAAEGWPVPASTASARFSKKIKKRFERGDFLPSPSPAARSR